jgi:hypothetical protein
MRHHLFAALLLSSWTAACATTPADSDDVPTSGDGKADGGDDGPSDAPSTCTGLRVPGDFATLASALTAASLRNADSTICLAAGSFAVATEYFAIPAGQGFDLRIVGAGRDATRLRNGINVLGSGWTRISIEGVNIDNAMGASLLNRASTSPIELRDSKLARQITLMPEGAIDVQLLVERSELGKIDDRCSLVVHAGDDFSPHSTANVVLRNSYLHGCVHTDGFYPRLPEDQPIHLEVVNNTFAGDGVSLRNGLDAVVANNLFTGATNWALMWPEGITSQIVVSHNAFWNNTVDFDGGAYPSVDDLFHCEIDASGPVPVLRSADSCDDMGDPYLAPSDDYFGNERTGRPDIGAVEAL